MAVDINSIVESVICSIAPAQNHVPEYGPPLNLPSIAAIPSADAQA